MATKRQIREAAKIYAASVVANAMGCGAESVLLKGDEERLFQEEVHRISQILIKKTKAADLYIWVNTLDEAIEIAVGSPVKEKE